MNTAWALAELDKFIEQTVMRHPSGAGVITTRHVTAAPDVEVTRQAQVVEQILDAVISGWRKREVDTKSNRWKLHREATIRAREDLVRRQEVRENLGDNAPDLSASQLHPWIWGGASSLWRSGHYREAVEGALKKLNAETENKVARRDVSETDLFKQSFSLDGAKAGKARLRRIEPDGSKTYESVQRGAMSLAEGIYAGMRNPLSHEADQDLSEQDALEHLAAASVLARWVDEAEMEQLEGTA